jgi:NAD-dependent deacetylase
MHKHDELDDDVYPSSVVLPDEFIQRLKKAKRIVVVTGGRMSAESGLPMYCGIDGAWKHYRPEDLTNLDALRKVPNDIWDWYDWRRCLLAQVRPNKGHYALVRLEELFEHFILITQSGDDLHRVAGSKNILEINGNIWFTRCMKEGTARENRDIPFLKIPPTCPDCGSIERPDIVWFGDLYDDVKLDRAWGECLKADLFISAGTAGGLQPVAGMSGTAQGVGAFVLDVNMDTTPLFYTADHKMKMTCVDVLPEIVKVAEYFLT